MEDSIRIMTQRLSSILSDNSPSIYLFGSVVMDDFKFGWSDIDILCLTENPLTKTQAADLVTLRQTLLIEYPDNPYFRLFEGIITTWEVCADHTNGTVVYWGTSGQRIVDSFRIDVFSTIELLKYGRLLYGIDKRERLAYPSPIEIHKATEDYYSTIRKYAVQTDTHLYSAGWLLDIARCLYTVQTYNVISKTNAGKWALNAGLSPEPEILKKAIMIRENPMEYKNDESTQSWLTSLGPHIQVFADVLEGALKTE
ncbi:MAG: nucleotidyltransferase domain-containing protein [Mobilitalea sp.]